MIQTCAKKLEASLLPLHSKILSWVMSGWQQNRVEENCKFPTFKGYGYDSNTCARRLEVSVFPLHPKFVKI